MLWKICILKSFEKRYKTINEPITCNAANLFTERVLKGKFGTQREHQGHPKGTLSSLERFLGTLALEIFTEIELYNECFSSEF